MSSESNNSDKKISGESKGKHSLENIPTKEYKTAIACARALFQVAKHNNLMDEIVGNFGSFIAIWDKLTIIRDFMRCYAIDRKLKRDKLNEYFSDKFTPHFLAFLQMIVAKGKSDLFLPIYNAFIQMHDELEGRERVSVKCAAPFTKAQENRLEDVLRQILEKRSVILKSEINPDLLGGFIIDAHRIRIDTSLKNDLDCLKRNILTMETNEDEH